MNRSSETKAPSIAPCKSRKAKQSSLIRVLIEPNDAYAAMGVMNVVRRISHRLTPSTALTPAELQAALQAMRVASIATRQQVYHALRDLTNAAYYAEPATWAQLGYPGPTPV